MKKKNIIICSIIFIIILIIVLIFIISTKNSNIDTSSIVYEFYSQYKEDVDSGVEFFRKSETFNKMNETNQIKEMKNLLKLYENNGIIKNLYYNNENKLFSFIYNFGEIKGALGGVSLKKWNPMMN